MIEENEVRTEIPLSATWRFTIDPDDCGESRGWQAGGYADMDWDRIHIPHAWNTKKKYAAYEGIAWYRHHFKCFGQVDNKALRLKFDAVFYQARVWLNGEYLGEHEGGYTPFEFDVGSLIHPGVENVIAVRVDNCRRTDRIPAHLFEGRSYGWKNFGGIVRDVHLVKTSRVFLEAVRVISTPRLVGQGRADEASVSVRFSVRNTTDETFHGRLVTRIMQDTNERMVSTAEYPVVIPPANIFSLQVQTSIACPQLWHFDHPHLYDCVTLLKDDTGMDHDRIGTTFGIRSIELKEGYFLLNGEPVRLAGVSRHADVPGCGLAETAEVMAADFDDLKALNMLIGRPVHYPQHEYIYDYCDRRGILLSPELPAWQLTACQMADDKVRRLARQQLAEMITAAVNHPCVWAWSVGNELESDTVAGRAFVKEMTDLVRSLDPSRPVSFASYHLLVGRPWADATVHADFVMMNQYFGTWHGPKGSLEPALDTIHQTWPEKTVLISEFGFCPHWQRVEGPQVIDPGQYYQIPEAADNDSEEADIQRQRLIRDQMLVFRSRPFVAAAIFWAYRGAMGVVNENGQRRASWQVLQEEFAPLIIRKVDVAITEKDQCKLKISIRTRGPVESDMPAYTLAGYQLQWEWHSGPGKAPVSRGEHLLPVLPPGSSRTVAIRTPRPPMGSRLQVRIIRPTGFPIIEKEYVLP